MTLPRLLTVVVGVYLTALSLFVFLLLALD